MQSSFADQVVDLVRLIPAGRIASYGQIARVLGKPRSARQVGAALSELNCNQLSIPWHRVVNWRGEISYREDFFGNRDPVKEHGELLRKEGLLPDAHGRYSLKKWGISDQELKGIKCAAAPRR